MTCRLLPEELAAATRLTTFVLSISVVGWWHVQLRVAPNALPCGLQRLRLSEEMMYDDVVDSEGNTLLLPSLANPPRNFASLRHLQHLQFTVYNWGAHVLPSG